MSIKDFINSIKDDVRKPEKAKINPKWDADYVQLTTVQVLKLFLIDKLLLGKNAPVELEKLKNEIQEKKNLKDPNYNPAPKDISVYHLAMVLDSKVVDVIRADERIADYLLASPKFVVFSPSETDVKLGYLYEKENFAKPKESEK